MAGQISIPERDREQVVQLFRLSSEEQSQVLSAIETSKAAFEIDGLSESIHKGAGLSESSARKIARSLYNLSYTLDYSGEKVEDLVSTLIDSIKDFELKSGTPTDDQFSAGSAFLVKALSSKTLRNSTKGIRISVQNERNFTKAEIASDIRSIFQGSADNDGIEAPSAAIIVHNLKIAYDKSGVDEAFFVTLDSNDLVSLKKVIERALLKHAEILKVTGNSGLEIVNLNQP